MDFPPPHMVWYEPLNDRSMQTVWSEVQKDHPTAEYTEVDAAKLNSIEEFSEWFDLWTLRLSSARVRILLVWHAHCLSAACQQMLRRSMEKRSFKCRVWFHTEEPNALQPAILSRSIVRRLPNYLGPLPKTHGSLPDLWTRVWNDPVRSETELETAR